jgi:hypothetical protein
MLCLYCGKTLIPDPKRSYRKEVQSYCNKDCSLAAQRFRNSIDADRRKLKVRQQKAKKREFVPMDLPTND